MRFSACVLGLVQNGQSVYHMKAYDPKIHFMSIHSKFH